MHFTQFYQVNGMGKVIGDSCRKNKERTDPVLSVRSSGSFMETNGPFVQEKSSIHSSSRIPSRSASGLCQRRFRRLRAWSLANQEFVRGFTVIRLFRLGIAAAREFTAACSVSAISCFPSRFQAGLLREDNVHLFCCGKHCRVVAVFRGQSHADSEEERKGAYPRSLERSACFENSLKFAMDWHKKFSKTLNSSLSFVRLEDGAEGTFEEVPDGGMSSV